MLESLVRLTERMDRLLSSMFQYARVGREELAREETDLNELVTGVLELLRTSIEERQVQVRVPERLPLVHAAKAPLAEVFQNLISNAAKYNDKTEKWIEVGVVGNGENSRDLADETIIYVSDNGIGIPEKHCNTVYRMFKRLETSPHYCSGAGVGLTITKKIIERHGGRIWLSSRPGEGTTFYFTLGKS
jgi:light-regulated signal transduction histidine kinase (bacteriophytochrome)